MKPQSNYHVLGEGDGYGGNSPNAFTTTLFCGVGRVSKSLCFGALFAIISRDLVIYGNLKLVLKRKLASRIWSLEIRFGSLSIKLLGNLLNLKLPPTIITSMVDEKGVGKRLGNTLKRMGLM
jgi:hypothetical protein